MPFIITYSSVRKLLALAVRCCYINVVVLLLNHGADIFMGMHVFLQPRKLVGFCKNDMTPRELVRLNACLNPNAIQGTFLKSMRTGCTQRH